MAVRSGRATRVSWSSSSKRHSSTWSATSENTAKLVPDPSKVAPRGAGWPGQTSTPQLYPSPPGGHLHQMLLAGVGVHPAGGGAPGSVPGGGPALRRLVVGGALLVLGLPVV